MSSLLYHGLVDDARVAPTAADRDGTAELNALVLGGMVAIGSSITLVGAGGFTGVLLWALVWFAVFGAVALRLSPHLKVARERRLTRVVAQRAALETSRQLAGEVLLADTTSDDERRAAAALLVGRNSSGAESTDEVPRASVAAHRPVGRLPCLQEVHGEALAP